MYGSVISTPVIHCLPNIAANKKRIVAKVSSHFWRDVVGASESQEMYNLDVTHERSTLQESADKRLGFSTPWLYVNAHSRLHATQSILRGLEFRSITV
jgi:hypothetical protein